MKYLALACIILSFDKNRIILAIITVEKNTKTKETERINLNLIRYLRKELIINVKFDPVNIIAYSMLPKKIGTILIFFIIAE